MEKKYVIGVDIGGTGTSFAIVDREGNLICKGNKDVIKTQAYPTPEEFTEVLCRELKNLIFGCSSKIEEIRGIGVGAPNANYYTGTIEYSANLPWRSVVEIRKMISDKIGIPVAITNDANAAAIGEMTYGVAKGLKHFIMITLGTGVGSGIVIDGKMVYGHDGFAGELGHTRSGRHEGRACGCGKVDCLETYTSAKGVARSAVKMLEIYPDVPSIMRNIPPDQLESKHVSEAAEKGEKLAVQIYEETGKILGESFADFVTFSSPEAIVLFGGLTKAKGLLLNPIKEHMEKNLLHIFKNKVKILVSHLDETDAAVLGASALGWEA
ncbi:MAG: ROK family protein [Candidatus Azobacteroides sp.]|nr:ROK family protein [Candidatus Azobacteroides sp.]